MNLDDSSDIESLAPYRVISRPEVVFLLRGLYEHKQLVQMVYDEEAPPFSTSILAVDDATNSLIVDGSTDAVRNRMICASGNILFQATLQRIGILFFAHHLEACEYDGLPAFRLHLPQSVIRLQRREFYRVSIPVSAPLYCTFAPPGTPLKPLGKSAALAVRNLSTGGLIVADEARQLDDTLEALYNNCRLGLPGEAVSVSLEVRYGKDIVLPNGKTIRQVACRFFNMSNHALALVQRYILKLERDHNAKGLARE